MTQDHDLRAQLMQLAGWLVKHGEQDIGLVHAVLEHVSRATNPFAYFQPGSVALEALRGRLAESRAATAKAQHAAEDAAFMAGKEPPATPAPAWRQRLPGAS